MFVQGSTWISRTRRLCPTGSAGAARRVSAAAEDPLGRLYWSDMCRPLTSLRLAAASLLMPVLVPVASFAQTDVEELGRRFGATPPPGYFEILRSDPNAFQFSPDNGWVRRGRRVAKVRNRLRGGPSEDLLLTQAAHDENGVVTGDVYMPVFLILFSNTDSAAIASAVPRDTLEKRLYGTDPAPPYSVHTYYREVSNDAVRVYGTMFDWAFVPDADSVYEGDDNGLNGTRMGRLMRDYLAVLDDSVDFGLFDNDGPDGIPNSGDDDGFVDAVVMIHPKVDGSCKEVNPEARTSIWAHRFKADSFPTNDISAATGDFVKLRDYIIQGGQGGDAGCTSNEPQAMGVVAHETGHLFGLPDLYEIGGSGAGIGHWGLMGSGNQRMPARPAHLSAWSKAQLGWVTEVRVDSDTVLEISPVVTSDTTYVLPIPNTNEFFILENRQRIGSDLMIHQEGLLIWHVDSLLARLRGNAVNQPSFPYAVALEQGDGRDDLRSGVNRGDRGDPFPGSTGNRSFGRNTGPSSRSNSGSISMVELDSIRQVDGSGAIAVRIRFEAPALIATTDTNAVFRLDGVQYNRFADFLMADSGYALDIDSVQYADSGRRRFEWISWSNGRQRSHVFTASSAGDTIIAVVAAEHELAVAYSGTGAGSVIPDVLLDLANGTFLSKDSIVTLVARVDSAGHIFEGWTGSDTAATGDTLVVRMSRPFSLDAVFAAPLAVADDSFPAARMGTEYRHQLSVIGGSGDNSWAVTSGTLPAGLTMNPLGVVTGLPAQTGDFRIGVAVSSGSQLAVDTLQLNVTAPALAVADVLQHLVGRGTPLSQTDVVYLDLLGNGNSRLDAGDFLAWVRATGASVTAEDMIQLGEFTGMSLFDESPNRERGEGRQP